MTKQEHKKLEKAKEIASRCTIAGVNPPKWVQVLLDRDKNGEFSFKDFRLIG